MHEQIISFLNKYTITRLDSQTSVITQLQHLPSSTSSSQSYQDVLSLPFSPDNKNNKDHNTTPINVKTPLSFLIKDLIIPHGIGFNNDCTQNNGDQNSKQSQKMLANILETLSHHQQLNNKYILTLIHYQMFITNVPYTNHMGMQSNLQTQRNNNPSFCNNPTYKQNYSNNTYEEQNSRIFNSKLQSEAHSQLTVKNQIMMENQNDGESLNNSNSLYQYNYQQSDSVIIQQQNKQQQYPKFSKLINVTTMQNINILDSSNVFTNNTPNNNNINNPNNINNNNNLMNMNINININPNPKTPTPTNTNNISNANINIYSHGPHNAIRAIYQYGTLTLKQQIVNRIASSTQFQQQQLWAILATLVQALSYLQQEQIAYGVLGTDKIFINNSLVKVLDPSATASDPLLICQGRLYSPQILNDEENIDIFKSDVYIIGMIILECGLLIDLSKDTEPNLDKYKNVFRDQYSKQLLQVIQKCLNTTPNTRPTFDQLKQQIGKQLNWIDFSNNYQTNNGRLLQPIDNDRQDQNNPVVEQIQFQYQECNHDILYEHLDKDQLKKYRKINMTEYQRARLKYLGNDICLDLSAQDSRNSESFQQKQTPGYQYQSHRSHRLQNRQNNSLSPMETRKNGKYNSVKHYDTQSNGIYYQRQNNNNKIAVPNLNMAISQSVYTDGSIPSSTKHRYKQIKKTSKKYQRQNDQQNPKNKKQHKKDKLDNKQQNISFGQQDQINTTNTNQKIKKTKLIKQKLVKNNNQEINQIYTQKNKNVQESKNVQHPNVNYSNNINRQGNKDIKDHKYGQSIQQQLYQQSESSYLYYNNNINTQPIQRQNQNSKGSSIRGSHASQANSLPKNNLRNSQNNILDSGTTMLKNTNIHYRNSTNLQTHVQQQKYITIKPLNKLQIKQNQNLFTDPNLLKTIKDDLARISTNKNLQNGQITQIIPNTKQNRYIK